MLAGSHHERTIRPANVAFDFLILVLPPLNIVLNHAERFGFIATKKLPHTEPYHEQKQAHSDEYQHYLESMIPTMMAVSVAF